MLRVRDLIAILEIQTGLAVRRPRMAAQADIDRFFDM